MQPWILKQMKKKVVMVLVILSASHARNRNELWIQETTMMEKFKEKKQDQVPKIW